ncbi:alpha/beta hydrolase [Sphingomonas sanguinis]|uniref:Alpha/beta hydrolase n=1 Tax=Sphingomonas sanguinis TaxID=33051 RepID=A0ABU5LM13_9SPHN|nr:alpha/beta fold hydrolase [Sphingomonas sanguinis]MDZ7280978.1 alpha/beta hydrolase [Sphingomonas sanguinis]
MQAMLDHHRDGGPFTPYIGGEEIPATLLPSTTRRTAQAPLEPVVFLPGLLCDQSLWRSQIDALADRCAPFVADLTLDDDIAAMAVRTLAAAPPSFSLVALSMGGYVALDIMRQAPERIRRLALIDTSARADTPERTHERLRGIQSLERGRFLGVSRPLLRNLVHRNHWEDDVATAMQAMAGRVGKTAFLRQQRAIMNRPDSRGHLGDIAVPTLIVVGRQDRITPVDHARELHDAIPGSSFHIFDQCGHMAALEEPERINGLLREWLDLTASKVR